MAKKIQVTFTKSMSGTIHTREYDASKFKPIIIGSVLCIYCITNSWDENNNIRSAFSPATCWTLDIVDQTEEKED